MKVFIHKDRREYINTYIHTVDTVDGSKWQLSTGLSKRALRTQFPWDDVQCATCPSGDSVFVFLSARRLPCRSVDLAALWTASSGWMGRRTFLGGSGVGKVESWISLTCYGSWEPFIDPGLASTQQIVRSAILLFPVHPTLISHNAPLHLMSVRPSLVTFHRS